MCVVLKRLYLCTETGTVNATFGHVIKTETGDISVRSTYSLLGDRTDRQVYLDSSRISDTNYRYDANGRMTYAEDEGRVAEYTYAPPR